MTEKTQELEKHVFRTPRKLNMNPSIAIDPTRDYNIIKYVRHSSTIFIVLSSHFISRLCLSAEMITKICPVQLTDFTCFFDQK